MAFDVEKIRQDFAVLTKDFKKKPLIYMDSACMSLKPRIVVDKINEYYNEYPACAGRSSHLLANKVTSELYDARKKISKFIGSKKSNQIIFTRNTTEGINLVSKSFPINKGDSVLTSDKEHNSNLLPFQILKEKGINHKIFKFNDLEDFKLKLTKNTKLVSVVMTSNADGSSQNVKEMIDIAHDNGSFILLDGAQSVPHEELNVKKLDCDFLAFSGHKMCGPTGTGVLYGKEECLEKLTPFMIGGDTVSNTTYDSYQIEEIPERFEAGLSDYAGLIGLGSAVDYLSRIGLKNIKLHEQKLNKYVTQEFQNMGITILGSRDSMKRSGIISFNIGKLNNHEVAGILNSSANIMVRSGMHCVHSWFNANNLPGSVRASLYFYNTIEECDALIDEVRKIKEFI